MPSGIYVRKPNIPPQVRFWAKVNKTASCWLWTAATHNAGYGVMRLDGRNEFAHRISLKLSGVDIPAGFDVDHLCRNPRCVNPSHLEPVSHKENVRRGMAGMHMVSKQRERAQCLIARDRQSGSGIQ